MRKHVLMTGVAGWLVLVSMAAITSADVKLPGIFGNHMVLQREMGIPVWGWAQPGEKVTVTLGAQSKSVTTDGVGKWAVKFDALKPGNPLTLKVQGKNKLQFNDLLVGEVWLCSGQSNMAMTVKGVINADAEIAAAKHPKLRLCMVTRKTAAEPQNDCQAKWDVCSPDTVGGFSATAFFFGRELQKNLNVPVGLIDSSWGGTPIQAWTSVKAQQAVADLQPLVEKAKESIAKFDPEKAQKAYELQLEKWNETVKKAKAEKKPALRKPQLQDPRTSPSTPGNLYNGMIAPLAPYAIRGAIWYQGESNAGAAKLYGVQLRTMIANWRQDWHEGDFPFLYVQLPNFMASQQQPSETGGWPIVREEMLKTLAFPNTGMAVTIDVGEEKDIHPKDKQNVGKRLAMWALSKTYGKETATCGPLYKSMEKQGGKIVVHFDYVNGGLTPAATQYQTKSEPNGLLVKTTPGKVVPMPDEKLKGFAIAGDDKQFFRAEAKIVGDKVEVSSPRVSNPVAVRYAWANNPDCNLYNKAGLAASPFRSDDWEE
jgi:sialate O-acetylesterase